MIPRWSILLTATALVSGSLMAAAVASANAATTEDPGTISAPAGGAASGFVPGGPVQLPAGAAAAGIGHRNQAQSTNWSGYAVSGSPGSFHSVSSSWIEPTATCTGGGSAQYAAFWVGLDGYNSNSVEQTGTDSDCSGGTPSYYGWYEMYPAYPVYFSNPVAPGDAMSASVTISGSGTYTLVLTDSTQGWTQTETLNQPGLANSSAEVITEAPSSSSGPLPLADFGTVNYSAATVNGSPMNSLSPTQIVMVGASGNQLDSTSPMDTAGNFSNIWQAAS
jgi:hypothetical protein